ANCDPKRAVELALPLVKPRSFFKGFRCIRIPAFRSSRRYNPAVQTEDFRILLALEPSWTISINGKEFLHVRSTDVEVQGAVLRFGRYSRTIVEIASLALTTIRVRARSRFRRDIDVLVFYSGERLPSGAELRRRRSVFRQALVPAISQHFGQRITRHTLHSDKRRGIGGGHLPVLLGSERTLGARWAWRR